MEFEIKGFRLGDILDPNPEEFTPKNLRLLRKIQDILPKAFKWSDPERRIFISLEPGSGRDPEPKVLQGEYLNVVEMIPLYNPTHTLVHEVDSDRTLIFDGNNHWKWHPRDQWVLARKKMEQVLPALVEIPYEESVLF